jgi:hypothetical protein
LVIEDDIIAAFDWYEKLNNALLITKKRYEDDWLCMKLFTSYWILDFTKLIHPYSLVGVVVLSGFLVIAQVYVLKVLNRKPNKYVIGILFVNAVVFTSFFIMIYARPAQLGVQSFDSGFGTVAVVFPHSKVKGLYEYIDRVVDNYVNDRSSFFIPKDLLIEEYKNANGFYELKYEPSLFQHIGLYSSLYLYDNTFKKIFKSYSFEDNDKPITFDLDYLLS